MDDSAWIFPWILQPGDFTTREAKSSNSQISREMKNPGFETQAGFCSLAHHLSGETENFPILADDHHG